MEWFVWMLAGIGAFWCIFSVLCIPVFVIGSLITLKRESLGLQDETKAQTAEDAPPTSEADVQDKINNPLASEQAGENENNDVTNQRLGI